MIYSPASSLQPPDVQVRVPVGGVWHQIADVPVPDDQILTLPSAPSQHVTSPPAGFGVALALLASGTPPPVTLATQINIRLFKALRVHLI